MTTFAKFKATTNSTNYTNADAETTAFAVLPSPLVNPRGTVDVSVCPFYSCDSCNSWFATSCQLRKHLLRQPLLLHGGAEAGDEIELGVGDGLLRDAQRRGRVFVGPAAHEQ